MMYLLTFFFAFLFTVSLSPLTVKISRRFNVFSSPKRGEVKGKPCLGGLAIYAAFLAVCVLAYFLCQPQVSKLIAMLVPSLLIVSSGIVDDARELKPFEKIMIQLAAAGLLISLGISTRITFLPPWANAAITVIWVLFITNCFNLLDITDGLASGLVIIISLTLMVISLMSRDAFSAVILLALIGAHSGFLIYNYPPARIYMGDTGSLFTGFILAAAAINISYASLDRPLALITPVLAMSLPIYDTMFLIIARLKKHMPVFEKSNDHIVLRLLAMGYSAEKSIWIMYSFSIFLAVSSLIVVFGSEPISIVTLAVVLLVFIFMGKRMGMVRIDDRGR